MNDTEDWERHCEARVAEATERDQRVIRELKTEVERLEDALDSAHGVISDLQERIADLESGRAWREVR